MRRREGAGEGADGGSGDGEAEGDVVLDGGSEVLEEGARRVGLRAGRERGELQQTTTDDETGEQRVRRRVIQTSSVSAEQSV